MEMKTQDSFHIWNVPKTCSDLLTYSVHKKSNTWKGQISQKYDQEKAALHNWVDSIFWLGAKREGDKIEKKKRRYGILIKERTII